MADSCFVLEAFQRQTQALLVAFALMFDTNTSLASIKRGLLQLMYLMLHVIQIEKGYYTIARKYEFYVLVARTISYKWAQAANEWDIVLATRT